MIKEIFLPNAEVGGDVWAYVDTDAGSKVIGAMVVEAEADDDGADIWRQAYLLPEYRGQGLSRVFLASHKARSGGRVLKHPNTLTEATFGVAASLGLDSAENVPVRHVTPVGQSENLGRHLLARVTETLHRGEHL